MSKSRHNKKLVINDSDEDILVCYLNTDQKSKEELSKMFELEGIDGVTNLPIGILLAYYVQPKGRTNYNPPEGKGWITLSLNPSSGEIQDSLIVNYDSKRGKILSRYIETKSKL